MNRVLAIANHKGGVGKSTIAANLATEAARMGLKTLAVDTDPQGSLMMFSAARPENLPQFRAVQIAIPTVHREVRALAKDYDLVVLDSGGRDSAIFRASLVAADEILVPIQPSAYDIWASETVFQIIDELRNINEELEAAVLLNMVLPRTRIRKEATDALADLDFPILRTVLHSRVAWKHSCGEGLAVTEWEPKGAAARELRHLVKELGLNHGSRK